jgi:hypothetical protein
MIGCRVKTAANPWIGETDDSLKKGVMTFNRGAKKRHELSKNLALT